MYTQVCSTQLLAELKTFRERVEEASGDLVRARDRLVKASVREECLKRCADHLTVLAETDRTRRDHEETELRTMAERLSAELGDAQCDLGRSRAVVKEMLDVVAGHKPAPVTCSVSGLREDNYRLHAELDASAAVEAELRAVVARLETTICANSV